MRIFKIALALCLAGSCLADESKTVIQAMLDTYYAYGSNQSSHRYRQYTTQQYYQNEPAINLVHLGIKHDGENFRGRFAGQYGASVDANYAAEPEEFFRYIQEAYAGVKLADNVWWDNGIYFTHIGMGSFISKDNPVYTRSIVDEYGPYYHLGSKLGFQLSETDSLCLHVINGWQNVSDEKNASFGTQYNKTIDDDTSFSHNTFIGNEVGTRIFNNFIYKTGLTENLSFASAFDIGNQELAVSDAWWYGIAAILSYKLNEKLTLSGRVERYSDPHNAIIPTATGARMNTIGGSIDLDYLLSPSILLRNEVKYLTSSEDVWADNSNFEDNELLLVSNLTYFFDKEI